MNRMKTKSNLVILQSLLIYIFLGLPVSAFAEAVKGRVVSVVDDRPLPFVSIRYSENIGTFSDIDGWFAVPDTASQIRFSFTGYQPLTVKPRKTKDSALVIRMHPLQGEITPVSDSLFKNTGLYIMKKVVENRMINDPEKYNSYEYTYLQKFRLSSILIDGKILPDTLKNAANQPIIEKPFFSMEILARKKMLKPDRLNESIISANVSGVGKKPYISLANQLQDFSVYDQFFTVLNQSFFSPVSHYGLKKFYYSLTDVFSDGKNDTIFVIWFSPIKSKSKNGLQGTILINNHGYAVQAVTAGIDENDPAKPSLSIQQQYDLLQDEKWFPSEKQSAIRFMLKKVDKKDSVLWNKARPGDKIVADNRTSFYQREINLPLKPSDFSKYEGSISPLQKDAEKALQQERNKMPGKADSLSRFSSDSIAEANNITADSKLIRFLAEGKIPLGYFNINYTKFFSYNLYEGIKLGIGAETNRRLSRYFTVGGYITYGLKDKSVLNGEWLDIYPKGYYDFRLHIGFRDMNNEFGEPEFLEKKSLLNPDNYRDLLIKNMYSTQRYSAGMELRPFQELNTYLFADVSDNSARENNEWLSQHTFSPFRLTRIGLQLRYSPGISFIEDPDMLIESILPKSDWYFNAVQGIGIFGGEYRYTKLEFKGKFHFMPYPTGTTNIMLRAGYIFDHAPMTELFNGYGSYVKAFSFIAPNSFTTMRQNEFGATDFAALLIRHDLGTWFPSGGYKFNPGFVIAQNIGFGLLNDYDSAQYGMIDFRKGYYESGFEINNLLQMNFLSWGVGIYYRYGPYSLPVSNDNFAYKFGFFFKL
jgi:hypothetical protein